MEPGAVAGGLGIEKTLIDYVLSQGIGVVFGAVILWFWRKDTKNTERRLRDLLFERKADRDELLRMLGRIETHLAHATLLRELASEAAGGPRRRHTDDRLIALAGDPPARREANARPYTAGHGEPI